ncbi:hypothetical protein V2S66_17245 [Streptomyces sp. V4-01]|uniref:Lipoprotein LpqB beta-propeller domain-containing protein n=1 Tax=Actinacidiphila polyblastidii TaxID=3110430 RepID=A0ABU7PEJ9_9ACTN|nr:hypothetical protein [Streptomyces sp. V4-01]
MTASADTADPSQDGVPTDPARTPSGAPSIPPDNPAHPARPAPRAHPAPGDAADRYPAPPPDPYEELYGDGLEPPAARGPAEVPEATRRVLRRTGFTITADGAYAACLAQAAADDGTQGAGTGGGGTGAAWFAERWTLDGPEPYAVPLPGPQPEEAGTAVAPLRDGRVLAARRVGQRHDLVLLYPSGAGTGEVPAGSLPGAELRLLPPAPAAPDAFALGYEDAGADGRTVVWRVHGGSAGVPERVITVGGRCTGGVWLDRSGRLLALDRALDGRTKAVVADLHTGAVSPLLQITEDSDDRLLLAEPDSGLLVLRSDATGEARIGWGVLGGNRPVRFPDALAVRGTQLTPVAAQPGQILSPESTVVALRAEVPGGAESLALWRPGERRVHWRSSPPGWLGAAGLWLPGGDLRLPYAVARDCGLTAYGLPPLHAPAPLAIAPPRPAPQPGSRSGPRRVKEPRRLKPVRRPLAVLPLQQAPLPATAAGSGWSGGAWSGSA